MTRTEAAAPRLLSTAEAAAMLGVGKTKLFELLRSGAVESVRVGSCRLVPAEAIDAFVAALRGRSEQVRDLLALVDAEGRIDLDLLPAGTTLADLAAVKRQLAHAAAGAAS